MYTWNVLSTDEPRTHLHHEKIKQKLAAPPTRWNKRRWNRYLVENDENTLLNLSAWVIKLTARLQTLNLVDPDADTDGLIAGLLVFSATVEWGRLVAASVGGGGSSWSGSDQDPPVLPLFLLSSRGDSGGGESAGTLNPNLFLLLLELLTVNKTFRPTESASWWHPARWTPHPPTSQFVPLFKVWPLVKLLVYTPWWREGPQKRGF